MTEFLNSVDLTKLNYIEVYFGGRGNERLSGRVVGSADGVLVLEKEGRRDYINLERVLAAWKV